MRRRLAALLWILLVCISLAGCRLVSTIPHATSSEQGEVQVVFLDTGQSECIVILTNEETVMVDTGDFTERSVAAVASFLDQAGRKTIDLLVVTHPHMDHMGGLSHILKRYPVSRLLFPYVDESLLPTSSYYKDEMKAVVRHNVPLEIAEKGKIIPLSAGMLTVLSAGGYDKLNDCSIVLAYRYGDTSFLLMADAELPVVYDLMDEGIDLAADVVKLGHHGSVSSTNETFLRAVSPLAAIVCCAEDNDFGHPHREVRQALKQLEIPLYRTDHNGTIRFTSDGSRLLIETER